MLGETRLQRFDTSTEGRAVGLHGAEGRVDRGRGLVPGLWCTGQQPRWAVRGNGLRQRVPRRQQWVERRALFIAEPATGVERKRRAISAEKLPGRVAASEGSLRASAERYTGCTPVIAYDGSRLDLSCAADSHIRAGSISKYEPFSTISII